MTNKRKPYKTHTREFKIEAVIIFLGYLIFVAVLAQNDFRKNLLKVAR